MPRIRFDVGLRGTNENRCALHRRRAGSPPQRCPTSCGSSGPGSGKTRWRSGCWRSSLSSRKNGSSRRARAVELVLQFTHDLLENVLEHHNAFGATRFVDHDFHHVAAREFGK